jgi:hypothetical protein
VTKADQQSGTTCTIPGRSVGLGAAGGMTASFTVVSAGVHLRMRPSAEPTTIKSCPQLQSVV